MTKLKCQGKWLRMFGQGRTDDPAKAHEFKPEEAHVLLELNPDYVADAQPISILAARQPPDFSPGVDRIWVKYKGTWLSVDKQDAYLGTSRAFADRPQQMEIA